MFFSVASALEYFWGFWRYGQRVAARNAANAANANPGSEAPSSGS